MTTLLIIVSYLITLMINRFIYISIQGEDVTTYPSNKYITYCWLSLIGTTLLTIKLISYHWESWNSGPGFFERVEKRSSRR
jgi:hypothetical protein